MMMKPLRIVGGTLIDPSRNLNSAFDILIEAGRIKAVDKPGSFSSVSDCESIDASGKIITPGFIDLHVHLREPGFEWKETIESGATAAIVGGFTTICCMPNTKPVNDSAEITRFIVLQGERAKAARVLPIGAISLASLGESLAPFSELQKAGCVAFSDDGEPVMNSGIMRRALEWCMMLGVSLSCHEEDKNLSCGGCMNESALSTRLGLRGMPKVAEEVMIARDIEIARTTGGKIHICHVSSGRSVELVRRAKNDGIKITCEVTPHHLALTEDSVAEYETNAKMSPPLREEYEREALIKGLAEGVIDAVASDHAPHDPDTKKVEFSKASFGMLGLQTSFPVLLELVKSNKLSMTRAVESLTAAPASCFGLVAGSLAPGMPADISVLDLDHSWRFDTDSNLSKSVNSPFLGREFKGICDTAVVGGIVRVQNKRLIEND